MIQELTRTEILTGKNPVGLAQAPYPIDTLKVNLLFLGTSLANTSSKPLVKICLPILIGNKMGV